VTLDDAVAAEEARVAAEQEAARLNRESIRAAASRFAVLAVERGVEGTGLHGVPGWMIPVTGGSSIFVFADGSWANGRDAAVKALRLAAEGTPNETLAQAMRDLADSYAASARAQRRQAGGGHDDVRTDPDASALEHAMARLLVGTAAASVE